jgi:hypothetical protein
MSLAVVLVVISQIKINVTNAYSGSPAWTNAFTRVTKHYPGRLVFLGVNLLIALVLMEANMFDFLNTILGFYPNCGMSWVVVATDIAVNKYLLKLSPIQPRVPPRHALRRQPGRLRLDDRLRGRVDPGVLRRLRPGGTALLTAGGHRPGDRAAAGPRDRHKGRYYLRRTNDGLDLPMYDEYGNPSGDVLRCHVCREDIERPDLALCTNHDVPVCSLCLSQDRSAKHVLPAQS